MSILLYYVLFNERCDKIVGNTVILKQSSQTPLCAQRFADAFREAGLIENVFQVLFMIHGFMIIVLLTFNTHFL